MIMHDSESSIDIDKILLSDYHYELPKSRIAQHPLEDRSQSKLLHYIKGDIHHRTFVDIAQHLPSDGMLVLNDTRVVKARMHFQRVTGAQIEVLLIHPHDPTDIQLSLQQTQSCSWQCIVGNKKRWKAEEVIHLSYQWENQSHEVSASWVDREKNIISFSWNHDIHFAELLSHMGELPLPPYIQREASEQDMVQYQTVYAREKGAVAAPTAGLHFTNEVFESIEQKGIPRQTVTLHVGAGTFLPVKTERVAEHDMHKEQMVIERDKLKDLIPYADKLVPVGTTSMRFVESLYWLGAKMILHPDEIELNQAFFVGKLEPYQDSSKLPDAQTSFQAILTFMDEHQIDRWIGETQILIMPGYTFKCCQGLITNFHMPETTLMLLVAALVGEDWKKIYQAALDEDYRFLSYGDSSLLLP